jgi:hypothetical protein
VKPSEIGNTTDNQGYLLRSRSHWFVVKREFKLPPYAKRRFIS